MTATAHALIGASIAQKIPDPRIGLPLAFLSHFLFDLVPHWDVVYANKVAENRQWAIIKAAIDVLLGVASVALFFRNSEANFWYLTSMVFMAQGPDWLEMPYFFLGLNLPISKQIKQIQSRLHFKMGLPWGIITQIAVVLPILYWALK